MFTKPVRLMLTATAILFVLVMWNVDDKPGDKVEVPDLGAVANGIAGQQGLAQQAWLRVCRISARAAALKAPNCSIIAFRYSGCACRQ